MHSDPAMSDPAAVASLTLFIGDRVAARGTLADIASALEALPAGHAPALTFDDATGAPVDSPYPDDPATPYRVRSATTAALPAAQAQPAPPGRPRLGVIAREVTLLPRHWDWLAEQSGGASAALRRLVDSARHDGSDEASRRRARERAYRVMSPLAGHLPGFEDATRALFGKTADAAQAFSARIDRWPPDVRDYLARMTRGAFGDDA